MLDRNFKYNYHDSQLIEKNIGPRKELVLKIHLDPIWNNSITKDVSIRFGAILNFDEINSFFNSMKKSLKEDFFCEICKIEWQKDNSVLLDFSKYGSITIKSNKISEI